MCIYVYTHIHIYFQNSEVFTNSLIKRKYKQHYNRISTVQ